MQWRGRSTRGHCLAEDAHYRLRNLETHRLAPNLNSNPNLGLPTTFFLLNSGFISSTNPCIIFSLFSVFSDVQVKIDIEIFWGGGVN